MSKKAKRVETNLEGLSFNLGEDGVWINFSSNSKHTSINLSRYAKSGKSKICEGLWDWLVCLAKDQNDND